VGSRNAELEQSIRASGQLLLDLEAELKNDAVIVGKIQNIRESMGLLGSGSTKDPLDDLIEETRAVLSEAAAALNRALDLIPINQTREDILSIEDEFNNAKPHV
jgi:hypothetical protein